MPKVNACGQVNIKDICWWCNDTLNIDVDGDEMVDMDMLSF